MFYRFSISTDNTFTVTNKKKTLLPVAQGIITQLDVQFPPGPQGLLHLQIRYSLHQVFPFNTDESFASDSVNITFREHIPILYEPFELQAYTWNEDETFDHMVIIRIGILPVHVAAPWLLSFDERIKSILGGS